MYDGIGLSDGLDLMGVAGRLAVFGLVKVEVRTGDISMQFDGTSGILAWLEWCGCLRTRAQLPGLKEGKKDVNRSAGSDIPLAIERRIVDMDAQGKSISPVP